MGCSVGRIGFYGAASERVWVTTHTEELSLWEWESCSQLAGFSQTRAAASAAAASSGMSALQIDYLVRCSYSAATNQLFLLAGTQVRGRSDWFLCESVEKGFGWAMKLHAAVVSDPSKVMELR